MEKKVTGQTKAPAKKPSGYQPGPGEDTDVHLRICIKGFSSETGERLHTPYIYKAEPRMYYKFLDHPRNLELLEVLYLPPGVKSPEDYFKAKKVEAEKKAAARAKRKGR